VKIFLKGISLAKANLVSLGNLWLFVVTVESTAILDAVKKAPQFLWQTPYEGVV
jgi:hypothetical protein